MNWLTHLFSTIAGWFTSAKARQAEQEIATLLPIAVGIVKEIMALAPNKTLAEVVKIADLYAVPALAQVADNSISIGNALLNIATAVLQKNHAPSAAISLLNTVVQLALMFVKTAA